MEVSEVSPIVDGSYKTSTNGKRKREYKETKLDDKYTDRMQKKIIIHPELK